MTATAGKSGNRRCPDCGITMAYLGGYNTRADVVPDEPPGPEATADDLRAHIEAMRSERNHLRAKLYEAANLLRVFIDGPAGMAAFLGVGDPEPVGASAPNSGVLFSLPDVGV